MVALSVASSRKIGASGSSFRAVWMRRRMSSRVMLRPCPAQTARGPRRVRRHVEAQPIGRRRLPDRVIGGYLVTERHVDRWCHRTEALAQGRVLHRLLTQDELERRAIV